MSFISRNPSSALFHYQKNLEFSKYPGNGGSLTALSVSPQNSLDLSREPGGPIFCDAFYDRTRKAAS